mmetsp:Transcript_34744/g.81408  ORF Transcript_34744/g.81408 Transcript_34744/m.81408 type:complete len:322 (-) Transcript_34744:607-1572(-)
MRRQHARPHAVVLLQSPKHGRSCRVPDQHHQHDEARLPLRVRHEAPLLLGAPRAQRRRLDSLRRVDLLLRKPVLVRLDLGEEEEAPLFQRGALAAVHALLPPHLRPLGRFGLRCAVLPLHVHDALARAARAVRPLRALPAPRDARTLCRRQRVRGADRHGLGRDGGADRGAQGGGHLGKGAPWRVQRLVGDAGRARRGHLRERRRNGAPPAARAEDHPDAQSRRRHPRKLPVRSRRRRPQSTVERAQRAVDAHHLPSEEADAAACRAGPAAPLLRLARAFAEAQHLHIRLRGRQEHASSARARFPAIAGRLSALLAAVLLV